MLTSSAPALVQQLRCAFLANVRDHVAGTNYLLAEGRSQIQDLIGQGASSRPVADALSHGFLEDWVAKTNDLQSMAKIECVPYGPERLFEPLPHSEISRSPLDKEALLAEVNRFPEVSRRVLEIRYSHSYFGNVTTWLELACQGFHKNMDQFGLYFYERTEDGLVTARVSTVSLLEIGLRHCFRDDALRLCEAPALVEPGQMNELHQLEFHPYTLPFEAQDLHETTRQHPVFVGLHDGFHATVAAAALNAQEREAAAILYDALKETLQGEGWESFEKDRHRLLDLNVSYWKLRKILGSLPGRLGRDRALQVLDRFSRRLRSRFPRTTERGDEVRDLLRLVSTLSQHGALARVGLK